MLLKVGCLKLVLDLLDYLVNLSTLVVVTRRREARNLTVQPLVANVHIIVVLFEPNCLVIEVLLGLQTAMLKKRYWRLAAHRNLVGPLGFHCYRVLMIEPFFP